MVAVAKQVQSTHPGYYTFEAHICDYNASGAYMRSYCFRRIYAAILQDGTLTEAVCIVIIDTLEKKRKDNESKFLALARSELSKSVRTLFLLPYSPALHRSSPLLCSPIPCSPPLLSFAPILPFFLSAYSQLILSYPTTCRRARKFRSSRLLWMTCTYPASSPSPN